MQPSPAAAARRFGAAPWRSPAALVGLAVVAAARLLTLPKTLWELDEVLFMRGVELFDPTRHRPHPPGYPLTVGLGKLFDALLGDPFHALVAVSVVASLVGYLALVDAYARMAAPAGAAPGEAERAVAVAGALLFHLSPPMLLYGPLALSDAPTLGFLALALAAAAQWRSATPGGGQPASGSLRPALALGAFAAAAVGCRPQLGVAVVPMVVTAWIVAGRRDRSDDDDDDESPSPGRARAALACAAAFAVVAASWLVPLVVACGGVDGFLALLGRQAGLVADLDAESARGALSLPALVARFVAHPWGTKLLSGPVLLAAVGGFVVLVRRRSVAAAPLLVLAGVDLAFGLLAMDPADAPRYALPSLLAVAFLVAFGLRALAGALRVPALSWLGTAALAAGFVLFTLPILRQRTSTPSPPAQAAAWAATHLPPEALVLVSPPLIPHAAQLLPGREVVVAHPGPSPPGAGERRPAFLFADGESGWPGAVTFRWQRSEAWGKLTRGYYRVVSWAPLPPCRLEPVAGVYGWEPGWRWLDRSAVIRVPTGGAGELGLTLGLPPTTPYESTEVDVAVGGAPSARLRVARASRRVVWQRLPSPVPAEVEVRFHTDRSFVPAAEGGSTDRRRLAVQLVWCELRTPG